MRLFIVFIFAALSLDAVTRAFMETTCPMTRPHSDGLTFATGIKAPSSFVSLAMFKNGGDFLDQLSNRNKPPSKRPTERISNEIYNVGDDGEIDDDELGERSTRRVREKLNLSFLNFGFGQNKDDDSRDDGLKYVMEDPVLQEMERQEEMRTQGKFGPLQRLESVKAGVVGALAGGIAVAPITFVHHLGNLAAWEFNTDMASLQAAVFAIVYRYAVREGDNNPMLSQGVVGGFLFVRALTGINISPLCSAAPLDCKTQKKMK